MEKRPLVLLVTGTPGTGKSTLSQFLKTKLNAKLISEKTFTRRKKLGTLNKISKEYEVDITRYQAALKHEIAAARKKKKSLVIDGHVACEFKLPVDLVIVLTCPANELEKRLRQRKYSEVKILDNVWAEENEYCLVHVRKNYVARKIQVFSTHTTKKVIRTRVWSQVTRTQGDSRAAH